MMNTFRFNIIDDNNKKFFESENKDKAVDYFEKYLKGKINIEFEGFLKLIDKSSDKIIRIAGKSLNY